MLFATALVLLAAVLHASWNLLVKTSIDRDLAIWGQFSAAGVLVLPLLVFVGLPGRDAWWPLVASSAVHVVYVLALARAYRFGDFSLAYPLSRGLGAAVAALGGLILLNETLSAPAWLAVAVVLIGLVALATPFLAGIGNIIGILIIGFAVYAAWQMNAQQPYVVEGPFRVGETEST